MNCSASLDWECESFIRWVNLPNLVLFEMYKFYILPQRKGMKQSLIGQIDPSTILKTNEKVRIYIQKYH